VKPQRPAPDVLPRPAVLEDVKILSLNVTHFAMLQGKPVHRGVLGAGSFGARYDDWVSMEARLSERAYAYLISFCPNGKEELCFPESDDQPPPLTDRPCYPTPEKREGVYVLNEGAGLYVFAVVVSSRPLPPYKVWRSRRGRSPWQPAAPWLLVAGTAGLLVSPRGGAPLLATSALVGESPLSLPAPEVVWWDDGTSVVPLTAGDAGTRGKEQKVAGKSTVARLTNWLRQTPEAETAAGLGFVVVPRKGR
jgi:hypothetical protein